MATLPQYPLTRTLGAFCARLRYMDVPEAARAAARRAITDTVSAMLAGADEPITRIAYREMELDGKEGSARFLLGPRRGRAREAAYINGIAAACLEFDDVGLMGHPSSVLVPALLAEAEATGKGGAAVITAYVAGYEVWARLLERERTNPPYLKGWFTTSVMGTVAAAAALANLWQLSPEKCAQVISMASSFAGGSRANFGSMTKSLQVGIAAATAARTLRLVNGGATALPDALEHRGGLLLALSPTGTPDLTTPITDLGQRWATIDRGVHLRKFPLCYGSERIVEATLELVAQGVRAEQAREVVVSTGVNQVMMLRFHRPVTALEAKFSAEFAVTAPLLLGQLRLSEAGDMTVQRHDVQTFMSKVRVESHAGILAEDPRFGSYDQVTIRTMNGAEHSAKVDVAHGHRSKPLSDEEMWAKFSQCAARAQLAISPQALFNQLLNFQSLPALARLGAP